MAADRMVGPARGQPRQARSGMGKPAQAAARIRWNPLESARIRRNLLESARACQGPPRPAKGRHAARAPPPAPAPVFQSALRLGDGGNARRAHTKGWEGAGERTKAQERGRARGAGRRSTGARGTQERGQGAAQGRGAAGKRRVAQGDGKRGKTIMRRNAGERDYSPPVARARAWPARARGPAKARQLALRGWELLGGILG